MAVYGVFASILGKRTNSKHITRKPLAALFLVLIFLMIIPTSMASLAYGIAKSDNSGGGGDGDKKTEETKKNDEDNSNSSPSSQDKQGGSRDDNNIKDKDTDKDLQSTADNLGDTKPESCKTVPAGFHCETITLPPCPSDQHRLGDICIPNGCDRVVKETDSTITIFCAGGHGGGDHQTTTIKNKNMFINNSNNNNIQQQPIQNHKFFTVLQINHPDNPKLGLIVELSKTTSKQCEGFISALCFVELDGRIINIGKKTLEYIVMNAIYYDAANHTIGSDFANLNLDTLSPGDSSPFTVQIGGENAIDGITTKEDIEKINHIVYKIEVA